MTNGKPGTYVTRVETNVKSRRGGAYDLAPCTLITGPNGSGKSALVDAISLALTGESRTEGLRKQPGMLSRLAPPSAGGVDVREMYARVQLSDGTESGFRLDGKSVEWTPGTEDAVPKGIFITDVARALLYGDAKSLMQAIAKSTREGIYKDALEGEVTKSVMPLFSAIWHEDCGLDDAQVRTIADVQKCLDATKARIKGARESMRMAKAGSEMAIPLSEEEIEELGRAQLVLGALMPGQSLKALLSGLADLPPFDPAAFDVLRDRLALYEHVLSVLGLLRAHVPIGKSIKCPLCDRDGMEQKTFSALEEKHLERKNSTNDRTAAIRAAQLQHALFAATHAFTERGMSIGDLQARRAELLRRQESSAAEPSRAAVKAVTTDEINQLSLIQAACTDALKTATDKQLGTVERRVNRALPPNYRAKIISEGGYRVELVKDKDDLSRDFRALSGVERTLLLSAFASATIPEGAPPVRIVVVDELWLDTRNMKALLKILAKVVGTEAGPSQAIVCAVKMAGKAVDGWSEIKLGGDVGEEEA